MASAKFTISYLKSSEDSLETLNYSLDGLIVKSGFENESFRYDFDSKYDGVEIHDNIIYIGGQLYYEKIGVVVSDGKYTETAYIKVASYAGRVNKISEKEKSHRQSLFTDIKSNWQNYISGNYVVNKFNFTTTKGPEEEIMFYLGSSTGYITINLWNGNSVTIGDGTPFTPGFPLGDTTSENGYHIFATTIDKGDTYDTRSMSAYSSDSKGTKSGDLLAAMLQNMALSSIDINEKNLFFLQLDNNTSISILDISKEVNLGALYIDGISITTLDFTGLTSIQNILARNCNFDSAGIDNLLITLASSTTKESGRLGLSGDVYYNRTSASDSAVSYLQETLGWTIQLK